MTRDKLIPETQLAAVVTAIYSDAHVRNWMHLSLAERSRAYSEWVDDDRIGGVLKMYMTPEATRAWIKDGPMKEYSRALRGAGRYARFGRTGGTSVEDILLAALGEGWTMVENTAGIKPFHAEVVNASGEVAYVAWDGAHNFKNLVWAALRTSVERGLVGHVVVTETQGRTTPRELADMQRDIVQRCGLTLHYVREQLGHQSS